MASSIVGALKVILSADTAEYSAGMDKAGKETAAFGQKFGALGQTVGTVGKLLAGAFTVSAITAGISRIADYAGKLTDLSAKTGLTTKTLQEMDRAAALTGTSLDTFANAAFKLGVNISGGGNSVVGALEKLGLSYSTLRNQSPDQQFNTIARALSEVENAQDRNRLAVELFGKTAKEILPAIAQGYGKIADSAFKAGDDAINAIDQASDALDSFLGDLKNVSVQLAGGFVIAVRETIKWINEKSAAIQMVRRGLEEWGTALEFVGLKAQELPKVLNATTVQAKNLPPVLRPVEMSLEDIRAAEKRLTEQVKAKIEENKRAIKANEELIDSQKRFRDSVTATASTWWDWLVPYKEAVQEANFELEELESRIPRIAQTFVEFQGPVQESSREVVKFGDTVRGIFEGLPNVILGAIQGGGDVLRSAGSYFGMELGKHFQSSWGEVLKNALPFGLGSALSAMLPLVGGLLGPLLSKIGGFFKNLFGGPNADELAGRELVAKFEANLHAMLNEQQLLEAGNESWKKTVIAIRDAYIAQGLTSEQAMAAAEKLWASSRNGAAASAAAIAEIERILKGATSAAQGLDSAFDETFSDRSFTVTQNMEGGDGGFASGTMGRLGKWFGNFGSGVRTALHGIEAVVTPGQAPAFAMDVLGASGGGGGVDVAGLERQVQGLREDLARRDQSLPYLITSAVNAKAQLGRRSR